MRRRIFEVVEVAAPGDRQSRTFDLFILSLIILNVVAMVMETVSPVYLAWPALFNGFEIVSVMIFSAEYIVRLWCCVEDPRYRHWFKGRLRYAVSFFGLVDLLAILPFYLPFVTGDFRFIRAIRLFRLFRVLKLARYSFALSSVMGVLVKKREELLCTLFLLILLLLFASSMMYYVEGEAQPDAFSSIPMAMWWGVATLTTVGYGDVYPITPLGKVLGAVIAVLGIGLFALPAGLIGGAYLEEVEERKNRKRLKKSDQDPETPFGFGEGKSRHLMLDVWLKKDIDEASVDHILGLVRSQFTILHEFEHAFSPHGYTKGFILSESHFFLHTYPESRFLSIDLYVCNPDVDLEALTRMFINGLEVEEEKYQIVFRGA